MDLLVKILMVVLTALGLACQKRVKTIEDTPIDFSLQFAEVASSSDGIPEFKLKRASPTADKPVVLRVESKDGIKSVQRKIKCGPLEANGQTVKAPDIAMFSFQVGPDEFPGMELFPIKSLCTFEITLTNAIGSTSSKSVPFKLIFDKIPPLIVSHQQMESGLYIVGEGKPYIIETLDFTNTLPYPILIAFDFGGHCLCHVAYRMKLPRMSHVCHAEGPVRNCTVSGAVMEKNGLSTSIQPEKNYPVWVKPRENVRYKVINASDTFHGVEEQDMIYKFGSQGFTYVGPVGVFHGDRISQSQLVLSQGFESIRYSGETKGLFDPISATESALPANNELLVQPIPLCR